SALAFDPAQADIRILSRLDPSGALQSREITTNGVPEAVIDHLITGSYFPYLLRRGSVVRQIEPWSTRQEKIPFRIGRARGNLKQQWSFTLRRVGRCETRPCAVTEANLQSAVTTKGAGSGIAHATLELDLDDGRPISASGEQKGTYDDGNVKSTSQL